MTSKEKGDTTSKTISNIELTEMLCNTMSDITEEEMNEFRNSLEKNMQKIFDNTADKEKRGIVAMGKLKKEEIEAISSLPVKYVKYIYAVKTHMAIRNLLLVKIYNH